MSTELVAVQTAVAEFDKVAAGIADLRDRYSGVVYDVTTTKGMDEAKAARMAIREPRYEVERVRKAAKAPLLALGKELDTRAQRITSVLLAIEEPIDAQVKAEESRKEAERQAKIDAELQRVARLQSRVAELRGNQSLTAGSGSRLIAEHLADLEQLVVDERLQEHLQQGQDAKAAGIARLQSLHAAALAHEAEQERIRAEREELARLRAEDERRQAAERQRIAEEKRQADAERAKEDAERRARIAAEEAELAARRAEVERQEREAKARAESEERARRQVEAPAPVTEIAQPRPTPREIVDVLVAHYGVSRAMVLDWLRAIVASKAA